MDKEGAMEFLFHLIYLVIFIFVIIGMFASPANHRGDIDRTVPSDPKD